MRALLFLLISITFLSACSPASVSDCGEMMCTTEFRTISAAFQDSSGQALEVKDFKVLNKARDTEMTQDKELSNSGRYVIATDADKGNLSEKGDTIIVSARHPLTNQWKETVFVIAGGACHVSLVSGPDVITL